MAEFLQCPRCRGPLLQDTVSGELCCVECGSTFRFGQASPPSPPTRPASPEINPLDALTTAAGSARALRPAQPKRSVAPFVVGAAVVLLAIGGTAALIRHRVNETQLAAKQVSEPAQRATPTAPGLRAPSALFDGMETAVAPAQTEPAASEPTRQPELPPQINPRELLAANTRGPAESVRSPAPPAGAGIGPIRLEATLDDRIGQSIQLAADMLLSQFQGDLLPESIEPNSTRRAGLDALCVYALLQAGQAVDDPRLSIRGPVMPKLLDALRKIDLSNTQPRLGEPVTYARSLRAAALAVYNRTVDQATLQQDVRWLIKAQINGAYSYDDRHAKYIAELSADSWDNSNSQYGLLGVWAGAEAGIEAPDSYWEAVANHWRQSQQRDGQWIYAAYKPNASLAMTCGGIASMLVTYDYLDIPKMSGEVRRDPFPGSIGAGLAWLEAGDNSVITPTENTFYLGYDLYSLERVGLASGLKYFGTHDWYRELATKALAYQFPNGAFARDKVDADAVIGTSYVLLFLSRGRAPLLMNKLRFDTYWANRPRDVANLARFASHELESKRLLNWQVVSADRPWQDWFDCPVLYIASHKKPNLTETSYTNLRGFVEAGGLIFAQADAGSREFNDWVPELARKICPDYELTDLPPTHPLFSSYVKSRAPLPKLRGVSNGSRLLIVHCPVDVGITWQRRDSAMHPEAFNLGMNVAFYAGGRSGFQNRVATTDLTAPAMRPSRVVKIARLQYAGNWNAEPFALERFSNYLTRTHSVGIESAIVALKDLKIDLAPIALLTGTDAYHVTADEASAMGQYVRAGGVLLVDPIGGRPNFIAGISSDFATRVFPGKPPTAFPSDHPVMKGLELRLRPFSADLGAKVPSLQLINDGQGCVVIYPVDVSTGLLGANTWGVNGFAPETCRKLLSNVIDWRLPTGG